MTDKEKEYYKSIKSLLIGRKIKDIYYEELDYKDDLEYWELYPDTHSIDMRVVLKLDNQDLIQIMWDNEFYCYGIGLNRLDELSTIENFKTIKVSDNPNWTALLGEEITEITVFWDIEDAIEYHYKNNRLTNSKKIRITLPQTWELTFNNDNNQTIWISALELRDKEPTFWADNLTVFFANQGQEKYKLKEAGVHKRIK